MEYENGDVIMTKKEATALAAFASKNSGRPRLNGVRIDPDGCVIACDGTRILAWQPSAPVESTPGTIHLSALEAGIRAAKGGARIRITHADGPVVEVDDLAIKGPAVTETFPPWRDVLPKKRRKGSEKIGINPSLFTAVTKVRDAVSTRRPVAVVFDTGGALDPVHAAVDGDGGTWTIIIMPMRVL